jgi:hypothetical protein
MVAERWSINAPVPTLAEIAALVVELEDDPQKQAHRA